MNQQARKSQSEYERTMLATPEPVGPALIRPADNDELLGVELAGTYRIEDVLGEGGMGRLYQARHLRLDRMFAVKVIHHPLSQREDLRVRFEREARVMSQVRSDHVVDIIDVVRAPDGRTCIVSELLVGYDLSQHLIECGGKLQQGDAVYLIRQCLWGLGAAHTAGVIHRDLKPSNLFVAKDATGRPTLKILDFGVAKSRGDSELTSTGVIVGTPAYMAPEQARGASYADQRSDLYAIGAVLYRMVTGKSPYSDSDAGGTLIRLMEEAPPRPSLVERSISPGLEAVIEKAMARDPSQRYQSAEEFEDALAPFDKRGGASTMIGGGNDTKALDRQARLVRPVAVLSALSLSLLGGFSVAAMLSLLVQGLSPHKELGTTEFALVVLGAAVAGIASAMGVGRTLANHWRNVAMVKAHNARIVRSVAAGLMALGGLELASTLWLVFAVNTRVAPSPLWASARVLIALAVSSAVAMRGESPRRPG
ncbi:MAG: serine/threonine-protein kinase [Myxococcales bacterium]